jgi:hypothetical protein
VAQHVDVHLERKASALADALDSIKFDLGPFQIANLNRAQPMPIGYEVIGDARSLT